MMNFEEIKSVLNHTSINTLKDDAKKKEQEAKEQNNKIAKSILDYFKSDEFYNMTKLTDIEKLNHIILKYLNGSDLEKAKITAMLKAYNYNGVCELLKLVEQSSMYFRKKINDELFMYYFYGQTLSEKVRILNKKNALLKTKLGLVKLIPLEYSNKEYDFNLLLNNNPNLYGAYYYIPKEFKGFTSHLVVIDYEKKLVYDFDNNITVNLKAWTSFYGQPALLLKGIDFINLRKKAQDNLGINIDFKVLEEVRRRV